MTTDTLPDENCRFELKMKSPVCVRAITDDKLRRPVPRSISTSAIGNRRPPRQSANGSVFKSLPIGTATEAFIDRNNVLAGVLSIVLVSLSLVWLKL